MMRKILTLLCIVLTHLSICAQNVYQNYPNPFNGTTDVYVEVTYTAPVVLAVSDVYGNLQTHWSETLEPGIHLFQVTLCVKGTYFLGAHQNEGSSSIVLICNKG